MKMPINPSHFFAAFCTRLREQGISHIHFIGVGGAGMCGLAEITRALGFEVSGSDQQDSQTLQRLSTQGIQTYVGHCAEHCVGAQAVVVSTAIKPDNPELHDAQKNHLLIFSRGRWLGEIMSGHRGISICGSHGKTTTSSLMTSVFVAAKTDPTVLVGGYVQDIQSNARFGAGPYFIAEADESDKSMLYQNPQIIVVNNIEPDHMDTYQQNTGQLHQTFIDFVNKVPSKGMAFLGVDDPGVQTILPKITVPYLTFGLSDSADIRATNLRFEGWQTHFTVQYPDKTPMEFTLNLPGKHNVLNALPVIGAALFCLLDIQAIQNALAHFKGVARRAQYYGELAYQDGTIALIDDYAHHPTEIEATLSAVKNAWPNRRVVLVYQLHRYTRTRDFQAEFVRVLSQANPLILMDIYAASEKPIPGINAQTIGAHISHVHYAPSATEVLSYLKILLKSGDVLLIMGAGDIAQLPASILKNI